MSGMESDTAESSLIPGLKDRRNCGQHFAYILYLSCVLLEGCTMFYSCGFEIRKNKSHYGHSVENDVETDLDDCPRIEARNQNAFKPHRNVEIHSEERE